MPRGTIVGVLNITPDSFSDGGNFLSVPDAIAQGERLLAEGADVLEVGGESTRPGAMPVSVDEELGRILPVIRELVRRHPDVRIAIDTVKAPVARAALGAGASIVNDVSAFRLDPALASVCAEAHCTVTLMHSRGTVADMASYAHATYDGDVIGEVIAELQNSVGVALAAGIERSCIILDPGLGFSKTPAHSVAVLKNLSKLVQCGFPVMVGASRKRFIGAITGVHQVTDRDAGTIGANVASWMQGATWFRVHNVLPNRHALDVAAAITGDAFAGGAFPEGER